MNSFQICSICAKFWKVCENSRHLQKFAILWKFATSVKISELCENLRFKQKILKLGQNFANWKKNCNVLQKWTTLSNFCIYKEIFVTLCKICKNSRLWENSQLCKTLQIMHNFVNYAKIHKLVFKLVTYIFWQGYFGKG